MGELFNISVLSSLLLRIINSIPDKNGLEIEFGLGRKDVLTGRFENGIDILDMHSIISICKQAQLQSTDITYKANNRTDIINKMNKSSCIRYSNSQKDKTSIWSCTKKTKILSLDIGCRNTNYAIRLNVKRETKVNLPLNFSINDVHNNNSVTRQLDRQSFRYTHDAFQIDITNALSSPLPLSLLPSSITTTITKTPLRSDHIHQIEWESLKPSNLLVVQDIRNILSNMMSIISKDVEFDFFLYDT